MFPKPHSTSGSRTDSTFWFLIRLAKKLGNADGNVRSYIKNAHNLSAEYGPAAPDIQQRPSVSNLYELSVGREPGVLSDINGIGEAIQIAGITTAQLGLPAVNPNVPGGAAITNTATDHEQIEFALKYTF